MNLSEAKEIYSNHFSASRLYKCKCVRSAPSLECGEAIGFLERDSQLQPLLAIAVEALEHEMGCVECGEGSHENCEDCKSKEALANQSLRFPPPGADVAAEGEEPCGCRYEGEATCCHEDCKICAPKRKL